MTPLAPILEGFFTGYLMTQRKASPHTIASYRDTLTMLLGHLHDQTGKLPSRLDLADLDAPAITGFLQHLETGRGNGTSTRNARLTAIHSLFRYAALHVPEHAALITRVLAMPSKRTDTTVVCFLSRPELQALLAAPDRATWHGRRDYALILLAAQTGLRVPELTALTIDDLHLGTGPHVRCTGKGRKERCTPLTPPSVQALASWLTERRSAGSSRLAIVNSAIWAARTTPYEQANSTASSPNACGTHNATTSNAAIAPKIAKRTTPSSGSTTLVSQA